MNEKTADPRLAAAASLGRKGKIFADIGTDHAFLPIFLISTGRAGSGVASDLKKGPCERARINVAANGLEERIRVIERDGLDGIEEFGPEDIYILGMGGELIAGILSKSDYPRKAGVRLILQPMTKQSELRRYLNQSGFRIIDETLCEADGRIYQLICAEYDGSVRSASPVELLLGKMIIAGGGPLLEKYAGMLCTRTEKAARGLEAGGRDASDARALCGELKKIARIREK